jgi:hypothetical protein
MKRLIAPALALGIALVWTNAASAGVLRKLFHHNDCCEPCEPCCVSECKVVCEPCCNPCNDCCRPHVLRRVGRWVKGLVHHDDCCEPCCSDVTYNTPVVDDTAHVSPYVRPSPYVQPSPTPSYEMAPAPRRIEPTPAPSLHQPTPMPIESVPMQDMGYYNGGYNNGGYSNGSNRGVLRSIVSAPRRLLRR